MVFFGGLWAAFQSHLGRMMGYAVVVEIGLSLLALGAGAPTGDMNPLLNNFFSLLLPYGLALAVWALALVTIRTVAPDLRFRSVMGIARNLPLASSALFLAHFSMAGFPLLAGFPVQLSLWENLAGRYPFIAIEALFGIAGLMVGGLRTLAVLVMGPAGQEGQASETWDQVSLLGLGMIALLLVGLMPQWFLPFMTNLASGFLQTGP
jgi:formate hydrogenlyase subunit 3/multisubunit Na+/H+ antiporter MnhD subunit